MQRKLLDHIFSTYIPTICLMTIAGLTLFIDKSHFKITISVALTTMLVIYTLHRSISSNLPKTSYLKMIDIWLFSGLILPFIIICILVFLNHLVLKESNEVVDIGMNGKKSKWNSKMFLKSMQIILPSTMCTLCIVYWIIGLVHNFSQDF